MSRRIQTGVLWRLDKAYSGFFRRLVAYSEGDSYRRPGLPRFKSERRWRTIEPRGVEKSWIKPRPDGSKIDLAIKGLPRFTLKADKKNPLPEKEQLASISLTRRGDEGLLLPWVSESRWQRRKRLTLPLVFTLECVSVSLHLMATN